MVSKRLAATIITFNILMVLFVFLPNLSILTYLASGSQPPNPLTVKDFNIFTILISPYYPPGYPAPQVAVPASPYLPFYAFVFALIINVCFIITVLRSKE